MNVSCISSLVMESIESDEESESLSPAVCGSTSLPFTMGAPILGPVIRGHDQGEYKRVERGGEREQRRKGGQG